MKLLLFTISLLFFTNLGNAQTEGEKIYTGLEADTAAYYLGGEEAIFAFIVNNTKTPQDTFPDNELIGKVFTSFIVEKDGTISGRKIIKASHKLLNEEAMRLLLTMPNRWYPALVDGKPVRYQYNLPISFHFTALSTEEGGDTIRVFLPVIRSSYGNWMDYKQARDKIKSWRLFQEKKPYDATQTDSYSYAMALYEQGEYLKAFYELNWLYRSDPKNPELLFQKGIVNLKLDKAKAACSDFRAAKEYGHPKADEWLLKNCP